MISLCGHCYDRSSIGSGLPCQYSSTSIHTSKKEIKKKYQTTAIPLCSNLSRFPAPRGKRKRSRTRIPQQMPRLQPVALRDLSFSSRLLHIHSPIPLHTPLPTVGRPPATPRRIEKEKQRQKMRYLLGSGSSGGGRTPNVSGPVRQLGFCTNQPPAFNSVATRRGLQFSRQATA